MFCLIAAVAFVMQLLLLWAGGDKKRLSVIFIGMIFIHVAAGLVIRPTEGKTIFWCYIILEAVCMAAAFFVYAIRNFLFLKGALILAQVVSLIIFAVWEETLPVGCIAIMLAAILFFLIETTPTKQKELIGLMPIFLVAMIGVCVLPQKEGPMDWSWAGRAYTTIKENIQMILVSSEYEGGEESAFSFIGYGRDGKLGGILLDGDMEQLRIESTGTGYDESMENATTPGEGFYLSPGVCGVQ